MKPVKKLIFLWALGLGLWTLNFLFTTGGVCLAQPVNLVPNPSFEQYDTCPNLINGSQINFAEYWINPTGYSPDYFNACDTSIQNFSVPKNSYGYQYARTGVAYAGIITSRGTADVREYIQTSLMDSLIPGKEYFINFYVSVGDISAFAVNNIGVYFSKVPISSPTNLYLPYSPQIFNNPITNPLTDTAGWIEVSGIYFAQGGEKYITIGNFNDDATTDTSNLNNGGDPSFGYYYVDDVSVSLVSGINDFDEYNGNLKICPNPSAGIFNLKSYNLQIEEITVYNALGDIINYSMNYKALTKTDSINIDLSGFSNGIYFLNITTKKFHYHKLLIINH